jgi:predicted transcriptional regulator
MLSTIDDATLNKVALALGDEDAVRLIEHLKTVDEITDDEIANKTGIRLNSVRKILYKLYDHSLVSLRRTRDPKTGWFIFHWKLQPDQLEGFILSQKRRVLENSTYDSSTSVLMTSTTAAAPNANASPSKKQLNSFSTAAAAANPWFTSKMAS